jgi:hypothetical protein
MALSDTMSAPLMNVQDTMGDTALSCACKVSNLDIVCLLLDKGVDPTKRCDRHFTPVILACIHGDEAIVNALATCTGRHHLDLADAENMTALYRCY